MTREKLERMTYKLLEELCEIFTMEYFNNDSSIEIIDNMSTTFSNKVMKEIEND